MKQLKMEGKKECGLRILKDQILKTYGDEAMYNNFCTLNAERGEGILS